MSVSYFSDKKKQPSLEELKEVLGSKCPFLEDMLNSLESEYDQILTEWKYYGSKSGWIMKTLHGKRNLFFIIPVFNSIRLSFVFGDKAVNHILKSDIPNKIKQDLMNARKHAEGRGLTLFISTTEDLEIAKKLLEIKIEN